MAKQTHRRLWLAAAGLLSAGYLQAALAADGVGAPAADDTWHFTVGPEFGATGFKGNGAIGPAAGSLKLPFHKVAKDTRVAFAGGVIATRGPLGLWLNGQYLSLKQDFDSGDHHGSARGHATELSAGAWYQVWHQNLGGQTVHGTAQQITLAPLAGVRWTGLNAAVDAGDDSGSQSASWAIPIAGARMNADLSPRWLLSAEADAGAWGRDFTTQGQVTAGYRLVLLGLPAVAHAGYQVLHQDHKTSDFHWNVTQYGPVAGLSVTF
ncbi:hypothetical protein ACEV6Q_26150 [Enterobacter ludwigii]|uniref:hypothetical protein n=1 Tax=Enterobacter ludwigii TaxID=299767 RepID=UPI003BEF09EE